MFPSGDGLFLEPDLDKACVGLATVLRVWDQLRRNSVEVATTQCHEMNVWEFAANECVFFASINHYPPPKPTTSEKAEKIPDMAATRKSRKPSLFAHIGVSERRRVESVPSTSEPRWGENRWDYHIDDPDEWAINDPPFVDSHNNREGAAPPPDVALSETVGVIYLTPTQFSGEVNLAVGIAPAYRGKGLARKAVSLLLEWTFEELHYHRVQAAVMKVPEHEPTLKLFTGLGFGHEGTRRRQVLSMFWKEYMDVTCMTILDTEWLIRQQLRCAPKNRWDELFERHQREREGLLKWEEGRAKRKRTASMETLRDKNEEVAEHHLVENPVYGNVEKVKRRGVIKPSGSVKTQKTGISGTYHENGAASQKRPVSDVAEHRESWHRPESWSSPIPGGSNLGMDGIWNVEHEGSNSVISDDSHLDALQSPGAPSPPPPSESSSSWWEISSQDGGSSGSWDNCDVSPGIAL